MSDIRSLVIIGDEQPHKYTVNVEFNNYNNNNNNNNDTPTTPEPVEKQNLRTKWGKDIEFLFSCIAASVGFGNVWRFPFKALDNGGGAFVIPYLIVLCLVGRPYYYLEMMIGQFSSRGSIKVFDFCPAMRGIGYGQTFVMFIILTYYTALMGLTIRYLIGSFMDPLPWAYCDPEWNTNCINSTFVGKITDGAGNISTAATNYFVKEVLHEKSSIDDGIGTPDWKLVLCLLAAWICTSIVLIRGVKSSGKASYFLAIFPYVIMIILLIRSVTLPGALQGIGYFFEPQFDQLLNVKVWYEAITQVFFSLTVGLGMVIVYSSHNRFSNNIYRDAMIVSWMDTFTSMLSGCIVFGILGHLKYVTEANKIQDVAKGGPALAFITYPDVIAKFNLLPQLFSVLFFLMLLLLGIGSNVGVLSTVIAAIKDQFPKLKHYWVILAVSVVGFSIGIVYTTPGGLFILDLLDFYGVTFIVLTLAVIELVAFAWIYGVNRLCKDIEFMIEIKTSKYWRICWSIVTPGVMLVTLIYQIVDYTPRDYSGYIYQDYVYAIAWMVYTFGVAQLPGWAIYAIWKRPEIKLKDKIINSFKPTENWGPEESALSIKYKEIISEAQLTLPDEQSLWKKFLHNIFS